MARYLFIVPRDQPDLYNYLTGKLSGDKEVQVLLDRRWGEQRQRVKAHKSERRRADRSVAYMIVLKQEGKP